MDLFGGAKKTKKATKTKKTTKTTKTAKTSDAKKTKKSTTTRSKSKAKGGNFLGTVGDLVAPTGWGPFATAAGLLALDRVDAALRRGTKEKKEKMKGGKKMKGGLGQDELAEECRVESHVITANATPILFNLQKLFENYKNRGITEKFMNNYYAIKNFINFNDEMKIFFIRNADNTFSLKLTGMFSNNNNILREFSYCFTNLKFNTLQEAIKYAKTTKNQMILGVIFVKEYARSKGIKKNNVEYFANLNSLTPNS